jgi:hypothetical protein
LKKVVEILTLLQKKKIDLDLIINTALSDPAPLEVLVNNCISKDNTLRENCYQVLLKISENAPEKIYHKWDYFVALIFSKNAFHRTIGTDLITNLIPVDKEKKFALFSNHYFSLLDDPSVVVANHAAINCGKLYQFTKDSKIIQLFLEIEYTQHPDHRKELIKATIIDFFTNNFDSISNKEEIRDFIFDQSNSSSPKTRKAVKLFFQKYPDK